MQGSNRSYHPKDEDKGYILGQGTGILLSVGGACSSAWVLLPCFRSSVAVGALLSRPQGEKRFLLESTEQFRNTEEAKGRKKYILKKVYV